MLNGVESIAVVRDPGGTYVAGTYTPGSPVTEFIIFGAVQPLTPRQVELLPEAARVKASMSLFADAFQQELSPSDLDAKRHGDRVTASGVTYMVLAMEDWTRHAAGQPHRRYALQEVGADE